MLLDLKRYDEVLRSCDGALAQGRPWSGLYETRGVARAGRQDFAGAIADYTLALEQQPRQPRVLTSRGLTYLVSDAPKLALRDFEDVLQLDAKSAEAHGGRGAALVRLGEYRAAIVEAEESLRLPPPAARRAYNAARIYAQAATLAAADVRNAGREAVMVVGRYQDRALGLIQQALGQLPADQRMAFWRDQVLSDPALKPLQRRLRTLFPMRTASARP